MRLSLGPARLLGAAHLFPASRVNKEKEEEKRKRRETFRYRFSGIARSIRSGWILHLSTRAKDAEQTTFCGFPAISWPHRAIKRQ